MAKKLLLEDSAGEGSLVPCYFFFGEETFLANQFVNKLKAALIAPDNQDFCVERLNLKDHSWGDVESVCQQCKSHQKTDHDQQT